MNRLFFVITLALLVVACNSSQRETAEPVATLPPQYYYYPMANVYFDSANKDFLFLGNSDTNWQSSKQIPAVMQAMMDKSVLVQNPSDPVWKDNENHKLVYSALLYATPNDTAEKKVVKPVAKPKPSPPKKEKKGLKKFFDKIFGGKKSREQKDGGR